MSTQLATTDPQAALHEKMEWSKAMSTGSLLPQQYRQNPGNLLFAAEYADNLGVGRIHVLTSIAVINGKPSPSADLMAAMVRTHGHKLRVYGDDTQATAELIRSDDPDFTFTAVWDIAKAQKAKLWGNKGPWSQYPAAMLRARAISEVVRMGAQDVMAGGIYTPEELGAVVNADGEVLEQPARATAERVDEPRQEPRPTPAQEPSRQSATDRLAAQLGATTAPAQPDPAASLETWQALIAATDTLEDLQQVYHDAYKEVGDAIIPDKDQRKTELQSAATDDQPIDAELVTEGDAA